MPKDGTKQKAEMTVEDFILLYRGDLYFTDQYEFMLSDLRSVIRGKLVNKVEGLAEIFKQNRFDKEHHLGMGDIRLTVAQQDWIIEYLSNDQ